MAIKLPGPGKYRGHPLTTPRTWLKPDGYVDLGELRERLGCALFPETWSGEECSGHYEGSWGAVFRSRPELEYDHAYQHAKLEKQAKISGKSLEEFSRLYSSSDDFTAVGDPPSLTNEDLLDIENELSPLLEKTQAVCSRRDKTEATLRQAFNAGALVAFDADKDNDQIPIPTKGWLGSKGAAWIMRDDLLVKENQAGAFIEGLGNSGKSNEIPNDDEAPLPAGHSRAKLKTTYIERCNNWPVNEKNPTINDDVTWAKGQFGDSVTYSKMREFRNAYAPTAWRKRGRKKGA